MKIKTGPCSACDVLRKLLSSKPPLPRQSGDSTHRRSWADSYDKVILDLKRTEVACKQDMYLHPLSTKDDLFFCTKEKYPHTAEELENERLRLKQEEERSCSIM